jgi:fructokinase
VSARYGGIEAGGSKWECAIGTGPDDLRAVATVPTTTPAETIDGAVAFFERERPVDVLGIGSFGPVDRNPGSPTWGSSRRRRPAGRRPTSRARSGAASLFPSRSTPTSTRRRSPSTAGARREVSTRSATSPSAPASAAAPSLAGSSCTAWRIPSSATCGSRTTERQTRFRGSANTTATAGKAWLQALRSRRGGAGPHEVSDEVAWALEAHYLAVGLVSVISVLSPERIVIGGGVVNQPGLLERVQREIVGLLNGYLDAPEFGDGIGEFVVRPALGSRAGVLGALALAESA